MIKRFGGNLCRNCLFLIILSALKVEVTSFPLVELTTTAYLQLRTTKTKDLMKYAEGVILLTMRIQSIIEKSLNTGSKIKASAIDFVDLERLKLTATQLEAFHNEGLFVQTHYNIVSELIQHLKHIVTSGEVQHLPMRPSTQEDTLRDLLSKLIKSLERLLLDIEIYAKIYAQKALPRTTTTISPSEQFMALGDRLSNEKIRIYAIASDIKDAMNSLFKFYNDHSKVLNDLLAKS